MLLHLNFWAGLLTACVSLMILIGGGLAANGMIRKGSLDAAKSALETYEKSIVALRAEHRETQSLLETAQSDISELKTTVRRLERDGKLKTAQLGMALRVIEHFEQFVTVYAKNRSRLSAEVCAAMDARLRELTAFRERAALELETEEINQDFYDWLVARATLSGPEMFGARLDNSKLPNETTQ